MRGRPAGASTELGGSELYTRSLRLRVRLRLAEKDGVLEAGRVVLRVAVREGPHTMAFDRVGVLEGVTGRRDSLRVGEIVGVRVAEAGNQQLHDGPPLVGRQQPHEDE